MHRSHRPASRRPSPGPRKDRRRTLIENDNLDVLADEWFEFGQVQSFRVQLATNAYGVRGFLLSIHSVVCRCSLNRPPRRTSQNPKAARTRRTPYPKQPRLTPEP